MDEEQLRTVAETFGVELDGRWKEKRIVEELLAEGITWDMWTESNAAFIPELIDEVHDLKEDDPEPEPEPVVDTTERFNSKNAVELLKMERWNPQYNILGYKFTREHPFMLMKPEDAMWIMAHEEGFRLATPEEAKEFYKE
jgi:hypothetical protein